MTFEAVGPVPAIEQVTDRGAPAFSLAAQGFAPVQGQAAHDGVPMSLAGPMAGPMAGPGLPAVPHAPVPRPLVWDGASAVPGDAPTGAMTSPAWPKRAVAVDTIVVEGNDPARAPNGRDLSVQTVIGDGAPAVAVGARHVAAVPPSQGAAGMAAGTIPPVIAPQDASHAPDHMVPVPGAVTGRPAPSDGVPGASGPLYGSVPARPAAETRAHPPATVPDRVREPAPEAARHPAAAPGGYGQFARMPAPVAPPGTPSPAPATPGLRGPAASAVADAPRHAKRGGDEPQRPVPATVVGLPAVTALPAGGKATDPSGLPASDAGAPRAAAITGTDEGAAARAGPPPADHAAARAAGAARPGIGAPQGAHSMPDRRPDGDHRTEPAAPVAPRGPPVVHDPGPAAMGGPGFADTVPRPAPGPQPIVPSPQPAAAAATAAPGGPAPALAHMALPDASGPSAVPQAPRDTAPVAGAPSPTGATAKAASVPSRTDRGAPDASPVTIAGFAAPTPHADGPVAVADDPGTSLAGPVASDTRGATTPQMLAPPPIGPPGSGLVQGLSRQLAQAMSDRQAGEGVIEIALDPPELGRVRLSFAEAGGALTLAITADRPETAELMRRHLSLLAQEFERAGLDAPSVDISDRDGDTRREQRTGPDEPTPTLAARSDPDVVPSPAPARMRSGGGDGLDLRL